MSREAWLQRIKAPERGSRSLDDFLLDCELERCAKHNGSNGEAERYCFCAELVLGEGKHQHRVPCPKHHDCQYVAARSRLVPQAEETANERVVIRLASEDQGRSQARWVKCFAAEMERLSKPLLNGASSKQAA